MASLQATRIPLALFILLISFSLVHGETNIKHYIAYIGKPCNPSRAAVVSANVALLASACDGVANVAAVQHYSKSFQGFSAMLTPEQASKLAESKGVISVFESKTYSVHTTNSWDFLGVASTSSVGSGSTNLQSDVIIGSIDTGVWPESKSFNDDGLGPVPARFKGKCVTGDNFTLANCNRKIIGARFYFKGFEAEIGKLDSMGSLFYRSARDSEGHGTHTASTAAGAPVSGASEQGMAFGLARGGAPGARLAIYKACWMGQCSDSDVLAAFDDAIADGVDIISISAGPNPPQSSLFEDTISIGSFHAFLKGVLVSASAGNDGGPSSACNVSPWILTVAASSINRRFVVQVMLGDRIVSEGTGMNPTSMKGPRPLLTGRAAAAPGVSPRNASLCNSNTLSPVTVTGKIVVCGTTGLSDDRRGKAGEVLRAGGAGMILVDPVAINVGFQFVVPAALIGKSEAKRLRSYIASTLNPVATISKTNTVLNTKPAPEMASFSSKGPNTLNPDIIKPDITAPGMNILAAWSPVSQRLAGGRSVNYNIISGTSMSCPHATGAAAIVKSRRRKWSPASIKSALMTTATVKDNTRNAIRSYPNGSVASPFDYGSGHLSPIAAINPGLVYDYDLSDIIDFLCGTGASPAQLQNLTGTATACKSRGIPAYNLNYPSIGVATVTRKMSVHRTVTNCHAGHWHYNVTVESPKGVKVEVVPDKLSFDKAGEKKVFRVDIVPYKASKGRYVFGAITWRDGTHVVRSPMALNVVSV